MKKYKYKVSVVIPIYNVEDYLEETIESVINQTIGFEKNIQMILVNDDSPDNSEAICLKYKDKYPNNVVYVKQKNAGVSAARNNGLKHAEGEYINFLDSDDKWEKNAFEKACEMLENNSDINLVFFRMKFFEASTDYHPLDYMFEAGDCVVDLKENFQYIKLQCCSILFRASCINLEKNKFNTSLKISEDVRFITEIVFENMKVGIVGSSIYYYRKRISETSAIQGASKKKTWYIDTPKLCYKYLFELSKEKFGRVNEYVQYLILYDLKWRLFKNIVSDVLTCEEEKEYLETIGDLLKEIDDQIIINFPLLSDFQKIYVFSYKYNNNLNIKLINDEILVNDKLKVNLDNFKLELGNIVVKGDNAKFFCAMPQFGNVFEKVYLQDENGKLYPMKKYTLDSSNAKYHFVNQQISVEKVGFSCEISLSKIKKFKFVIKSDKKTLILKNIFKYNFSFSKRNASAFLVSNNYFIKYNKKEEYFYILKRTFMNRLKLESYNIYHMLLKKQFKPIILRIFAKLYSIYTKFSNKEIWIISDRLNVAGDNGEAFFRYLAQEPTVSSKFYFVISGKSEDGKKLKKEFGKKVLFSESLKYKILFLNSSKIISAQADAYVTNPFGRSKIYFTDFFKFKFVFLQHGLTKEDLSPWLNINNKVIDLFCVSTKQEKESIYKFNYNYSRSVAKLTGMARYDLLKNEEIEKTVLLMPTWRRGLTTNLDPVTGLRKYDENFKKTQYFKFFNDLINDERLLKVLKETGYKIKFVPHNNMLQQIDDFDCNEFVIFAKEGVSYKDEFNKSSLLVTDYSSVFFDFAYLNKPIIYCQFDRENFFKGQIFDQGYYDYKKDGFGPVCETYEETIKDIINYLNKDCVIEAKYSNRIEKFYEFKDNKNCERIYNEIINIK